MSDVLLTSQLWETVFPEEKIAKEVNDSLRLSKPWGCVCVIKHFFVCRATWTSPAAAACRSAPWVSDLGLHCPAQLGPAHHPHGWPCLPCHGPQQDSYYWQDQVLHLLIPQKTRHHSTWVDECCWLEPVAHNRKWRCTELHAFQFPAQKV